MVLPMSGVSSQTANPEPQSEKKTSPEKVNEKVDDKIYRKEDGIVMPKPVFTPEPDFSEHARKKKIQGTVKLAGYVGTDGAFHDVHITQPLEKSLDANALAAVNRWKFKPCSKDGRLVNCHLEVEVGFYLFR
jgi:periplasmic protein TonB